MEALWSMLTQTLRALRRSPGLAIGAVSALAMGIGFTTTMFSIVHGGTRDLPFDRPHQLVAISAVTPRTGGRDLLVSDLDYAEWSRQQRAFEGLAAFEEWSVNLGGDTRHPERRAAAAVTPNTFALLAERAVLGRAFVADDARPGTEAVVLLGYDLWRTRFAADTAILGRLVRVDGHPRAVVGVMPKGFGFPIHSELWMPLAIDPSALPVAPGHGSLTVFGRLRDGVSLDAARAELATIASRMARAYPQTHVSATTRVYPFVQLELEPSIAKALYLMVGVVSFVLLIACANVANLLLARAAARARDTAIRTALGATRRRIVIQQLTESLVLAALGGVLGVAIAYVAVGFFARSTGQIIEAFWMDFRVDRTVLAFASGLVMLAAVVAGLAPALRASLSDVAEVLKDSGAGTTGLRIGRLARSLVVVEVALATGFLIMTMTFTKSAVALRTVHFPFPARAIFTGQLGLLPDVLGSADRRARFAADVLQRIEAVPGVTAAALVSVLPGKGAGNLSFSLDAPGTGSPAARPTAGLALVTPEFFAVLGASARRGRLLSWQDAPTAPAVAVVNDSWVRRFSPDREPLGRRVWFGETGLEIVGVVPDLQMQDPEDHDAAGVYASLLQLRPYVIRVMARASGDPMALTAGVRAAVETVDPDVPLFETARLHDAIYADKKVLDVFGTLFAVFGAGALFMTVVGLYGLVSFAVTRRTREIGVRVALGAAPRNVVALVLRHGAAVIGLGTASGLLIAFTVSRVLAATLEPIEPAGALSYAAITGILVAASLIGLLRPVGRALALEPVAALRAE